MGTTRRTNIEIDEELLREAVAATGLRTKRAVVEAGLRALVERANRKRVAEMFGQLPGWEGDLDVLRGRKPQACARQLREVPELGGRPGRTAGAHAA